MKLFLGFLLGFSVGVCCGDYVAHNITWEGVVIALLSIVVFGFLYFIWSIANANFWR